MYIRCSWPKDPTFYLIPSSGQSNSIGGGEEDSITKVSTAGILKVNPNNTALVPGGEPTTGYENRGDTETHATVMGDYVASTLNKNIIVSNSGEGGMPIVSLSKGTGPFNHLVGAVNRARLAKPNLVVPFIIFIHGETDSIIGTTIDQYKTRLLTLYADLVAEISAITRQPDTPIMEMFLTSGGMYDTTNMRAAAVLASQTNPKIHVMAENSSLPYVSDNAHLTAEGYRTLGRIIGEKIVSDWPSQYQ